jgi:hypothetical protein
LLASAITNSQTTLTVTATQGALFPSPGANQIFVGTLEDTSGNIEVVWCTGRTGDTCTIVRGQEGTTAAAFASGSRFEIRCTAGMLQAFLQKNGGDTLAGTTNVSGVIQLGSGGSLQGGEYAGGYLRSGPGVTSGQVYVSGGVPYSGTSPILTAASLVANIPSGYALLQSQMIVMWAGSSASIPAGFHLCDGTNGTPNLEDQFIVGGGGSLPTSGTYSAVTGSTTPAGGTTSGYTLGLSDLPSHVHPFDYAAGSGGLNYIGIPGFALPTNYIFNGSGTGQRNSFAGSPNTGAGSNAHTHVAPGAPHTHTQSIPYKAVFFIMKL